VNRLVRAKELCYSKTANRESVFAQAVFLATGKDPVEPGVRGSITSSPNEGDGNNGSSSNTCNGEGSLKEGAPPPRPPSRRSAPGLPLLPPLPPPLKAPICTYAPMPRHDEANEGNEEFKEGDGAGDVGAGGGGDVSMMAVDDVTEKKQADANEDDVSMTELLEGMGHASYGAFLQQVRRSEDCGCLACHLWRTGAGMCLNSEIIVSFSFSILRLFRATTGGVSSGRVD